LSHPGPHTGRRQTKHKKHHTTETMRTILSALTEGLQTYFDQVYLRSNINQKVDPEKF
jgi:hypothetical protein